MHSSIIQLSTPHSINHKSKWKVISKEEEFHRFNFAVSVHKQRHMFIAGGYGENGIRLRSSSTFDILTQTHLPLPDLPQEFIESHTFCKGAIFSNHFYVVGNFGSMIRLDRSTQCQWQPILQNNVKLQSLEAVISFSKYIFIFGDCGNNNTLYEPCLEKFTDLPKIIAPRRGAAYASVDDKIYVIGGFQWNRLANTASVEVFNLSNMTWTLISPLPHPIRNASATVIDNRWIIVIGGHSHEHKHSPFTYVFDTCTQKWTESRMILSAGRTLHECTTFNGCEVAMTGGLTGRGINFCSFEIVHKKHIIPNWEIIGIFILMRQLVNSDRASIKTSLTGANAEVKIFHSIMRLLIAEFNRDLFRFILSFLI